MTLVAKWQVMIFISQSRRKEKAKYKHCPDNSDQFRIINSLFSVSLWKVFIMVACFCLFLWCFLSCISVAFQEETSRKLLTVFQQLSMYSLFILSVSVFVSVSPSLPSPLVCFFLPSPLPFFFLLLTKNWIRETAKLEEIRTGIISNKLFLYFFLTTYQVLPCSFLICSEPCIKVQNVPKKLLNSILLKAFAQWEKCHWHWLVRKFTYSLPLFSIL